MKNQKCSDPDVSDICRRIWTEPIRYKAKKDPMVGMELEFYAFHKDSYEPLGMKKGVQENQDLFVSLDKEYQKSFPEKRYKKQIEPETGLILGVGSAADGGWSCEPGGQIEYSSAPQLNLDDLVQDIFFSLKRLEAANANRYVFLPHGTNPLTTADHPLLLPKTRYQIMTRYFQSSPPSMRGIDMMRHSAAVQINVDISGYEEWQDAARLAIALTPLTAQLFANSRFFQGHKSAFLSERENIWEHMDPSRSGYFLDEKSLASGENLETLYARWAKNAYVFHISKLSQSQQPLFGELTFEQWMESGFHGVFPEERDWQMHLATLFPHLRLRQFLEIRHVDAQPFSQSFAAVSFFYGLLCHAESRKKCWQLLRDHNFTLERLVLQKGENYQQMFLPLLSLAQEELKNVEQQSGDKALQAYRDFLSAAERNDENHNALSFVQKYSTDKPAAEFMKFLD